MNELPDGYRVELTMRNGEVYATLFKWSDATEWETVFQHWSSEPTPESYWRACTEYAIEDKNGSN